MRLRNYSFIGAANRASSAASASSIRAYNFYSAGQTNRFSGGTATANPTEYTISLWARPSLAALRNMIARSDNNPQLNYSHELRQNLTAWQAYIWDGSVRTATSATAPVVDVWHHVCVTAKNNDFMQLYVNGVAEGAPVAIVTMWAGGNDWWIGVDDAQTTGNYAGSLSKVAIWSKKLTPAQIAALAVNTCTPSDIETASLILYCPMQDTAHGSAVVGDWGEFVGGLTQTKVSAPIGSYLVPPADDAAVTSWAARVVANSGATPNAVVKATLTQLVLDLKAANIYTKMRSVNCVVPTDLATAMVPLIFNDGISPWVAGAGSAAWVAGDLTVNGLRTVSSAKWLNTDIALNVAPYTTETNGVGYSLYVSTGVAEVTRDVGVVTGAFYPAVVAHLSLSGTGYWDAGNGGAGERLTMAVPAGLAAFYSVNRLNFRLSFEYGSSVTAWTKALSTTDTSAANYPNSKVYFYAAHDGAVATNPCTKGYSFMAVHTGLETVGVDEPNLLFLAVDKMRRSFGGGWV